MNTYYNEAGKKLGVAWSTMMCGKSDEKEDHKPHSHDPQYACYGPYMCGGYPVIDLYDTPKRKPVN